MEYYFVIILIINFNHEGRYLIENAKRLSHS